MKEVEDFAELAMELGVEYIEPFKNLPRLDPIKHLKQVIQNLDGVVSVDVEEDMELHAICVTVEGGNAFDIAKALEPCLPLGVLTLGDIEYEVETCINPRIMRFSRPSKTS